MIFWIVLWLLMFPGVLCSNLALLCSNCLVIIDPELPSLIPSKHEGIHFWTCIFHFLALLDLLYNVSDSVKCIWNDYFVTCQVGVTHYFSILKAKQELGYVPMVSPREGMANTISYWQERKRRSVDGPTIYAWLFCVIGMSLLFTAAYVPDFGPVSLSPLRAFVLFFFRSMWAARMIFILAVAAHVGEAIYAWYLAKKIDPSNSKGWFWQTFVLGIFSLRLLLKRARK